MWVERHRPHGRRGPRAKPSKLHLLRIRADNTCPIAHIPRAACSAPRRLSPQSLWGPAQLSSLGVLSTPGGLTLRTLNPGPHASWPRPSSRSHRRSSWGRGLGDWWPLVRSSGMEWGPHLHRTRVNSRAQWKQTLGGHLHLGDGFISHSLLVCSQKGELRGAWGPPGLGKSWPPSSCLQRPCQGPPPALPCYSLGCPPWGTASPGAGSDLHVAHIQSPMKMNWLHTTPAT